ncbi:DUF4286 family protein [Colwelliaceae bacterium 6441]
MALPKLLMIVNVDIEPAIETEWDHWYDTVHLPEIVECPGFVKATRYKAPEVDENGRLQQVTIYVLDREDAMTTPECLAVRGVGPFPAQATAKARLMKYHTVYEKGDINNG